MNLKMDKEVKEISTTKHERRKHVPSGLCLLLSSFKLAKINVQMDTVEKEKWY